jgi:hypothetical protein
MACKYENTTLVVVDALGVNVMHANDTLVKVYNSTGWWTSHNPSMKHVDCNITGSFMMYERGAPTGVNKYR